MRSNTLPNSCCFPFLFVCLVLPQLAVPVFAGSDSIRINEIYYDPPVPSAEEGLFEFIELYVVQGGIDPSYWYLTDWDENNYWEIPGECPEVATGDFIIIHIGAGADDVEGPVYHFYMGHSDSQLSNLGDPLTLHLDSDSTHDRRADPVLDFVTYEGGTDAELGESDPWSRWPNDGLDPTDPGPEAPDNMGKSVQLFGADRDDGSNWQAGPPTEGRANSLIAPVYWADTIRDAREQSDGTIVGVTAVIHSPVGALNAERCQFWLQDETAGIVVDNTPERTTEGYALGDVLSVTGTIWTRYGERQIVLEADPGEFRGTGPLQEPAELTVEQLRESVLNGSDEYQGCLARLKNVRFDNLYWDDWRSDTSYRIRQAGSPDDSAKVYIRIEDGCELIGDNVPKGVPMTVTGIVSRFFDYPRILPRYRTDLQYEPRSGLRESTWAQYR